MSLFAREVSKFLSRPVELYLFQSGNKTWTYTSSDKTVEWNGVKWKPETIQRGEILNSNDLKRSDLKVTISQKSDLKEYFFNNVLQRKLELTIYRLQLDDNESAIQFKGTMGIFDVKNELEVVMTFQQIGQFVLQDSQRYTYGSKCNHNQYKSKCGLNLAANTDYNNTIINIEGNKITVADTGKISDYYKGGMLWYDDENNERIEISIIDDIININREITIDSNNNLKIGDEVNLSYGCKNSSEGCKAVNNFENFSGFEYLTTDNYFSDGIKDQ